LTDDGDWSSLAAELIEETHDVSEESVLVIHENIEQVLDCFFLVSFLSPTNKSCLRFWYG
jgi:hypothetical protein